MTKMTWNEVTKLEDEIEEKAIAAYRKSMREQGFLLNPTKVTPQWEAAYKIANDAYNKVKSENPIDYDSVDLFS